MCKCGIFSKHNFIILDHRMQLSATCLFVIENGSVFGDAKYTLTNVNWPSQHNSQMSNSKVTLFYSTVVDYISICCYLIFGNNKSLKVIKI